MVTRAGLTHIKERNSLLRQGEQHSFHHKNNGRWWALDASVLLQSSFAPTSAQQLQRVQEKVFPL